MIYAVLVVLDEKKMRVYNYSLGYLKSKWLNR